MRGTLVGIYTEADRKKRLEEEPAEGKPALRELAGGEIAWSAFAFEFVSPAAWGRAKKKE